MTSPRDRTTPELSARLKPILEVVRQINREFDLRSVLTRILEILLDTCNARRASILIFRGRDKVKLKLALDRAGHKPETRDLGLSRQVLARVRDEGRRVLSLDARVDPALLPSATVPLFNLRSILCLPLRIKDRTIGAVYLDNPEQAGAFGPREIETAELLTEHAALAMENAHLQKESSRDRLTGVYNHAYFLKRLERELERARQGGHGCGLLMLDLDDFKSINDTHGHEAGNVVLKHVARVLGTTVRGDDLVARVQDRPLNPTVARYGGDEFEVILPGAGRDGTRRAADRLVLALAGSRVAVGEKRLALSVSVGGAVFPDDAQGAQDLRVRADEALYKSKRAGKNRATLYGQRPATR
jgi:diguanylate cyclase (GGDEF)-like protein